MRRFQFSLRTFLIGCVAAAILIALPRYRSLSQRYAAKVLMAKGVELQMAEHPQQSTWSWLMYGDNHYNYVQRIVIEDTRISHSDVRKMREFPFVRIFHISNCPSSTVLLDRIAEFKRVQGIGIEGSPILQRHIVELAKLDLGSLGILDPPDADLQLSVIRSVDHSGLQYLHLSGREISDATLRDVANLEGLVDLTISHAAISDAGLKPLANLKNLRWLRIYNCQIRGSTLSCLAKCPLLEELNLQGSTIDSTAIDEIVQISSLRVVELQSTRVTKEDTLKLRKSSKIALFSDFMFQ